MAKKWALAAGVGVLAVAVIAAAALLTSHEAPTSDSPVTTPVGLSGSTESTATSSAASLSGDARAAGSMAPPSSGSTAARGTAHAETGTAGLTPLKPFPQMDLSNLPTQDAKDPAAKGAALPRLASAPSDTISALKPGQVADGATYRVTLRPYGFGPTSRFGTRIAVRVDAAQPLGSAPKLSSIVDANVLVIIDTTRGGTVTSGGTYQADLQFRSDGDRLWPILSGVSAK